MKKYKKYPTKLLQIRFSLDEYDEVIKFIKKFKVTRREWVLTVLTELQEMNIIRDGQFYTRHHEYAYERSDKWDNQLSDDSQCEICGEKQSEDYRGHRQLNRHHQDGYEGENAFKVRIVCKRCHGVIHGKKLVGQEWESVKQYVLKYKKEKWG